MYLSDLFSKFFKSIILVIILFSLNQCGLYKKTDAREIPTNAKERAKKKKKKWISKKLIGKRGGEGTFEFASSNEMWRATIEILDFIPLNNADYGGGIIITDWYNENNNDADSLKIMVRFLSNEVRADGLKVSVYKKKCQLNTGVLNCSTKLDNSEIGQELKLAILKKAAIYKEQKEKDNFEPYTDPKNTKN